MVERELAKCTVINFNLKHGYYFGWLQIRFHLFFTCVCLCVREPFYYACLLSLYCHMRMSFCRQFHFFLFKNLFKWFAWFCSLYLENCYIPNERTYSYDRHVLHPQESIMNWMLYLNANALHTQNIKIESNGTFRYTTWEIQ